MHPEGGIVKTEPVNKVKPGEEHGGSNSWKIASYISFVVIVGMVLFNVMSNNRKKPLLFFLLKSGTAMRSSGITSEKQLPTKSTRN